MTFGCIRLAVVIGLGLMAVGARGFAEEDQPMKNGRSLTSDAQIACIRASIAKYPVAKKMADGIIKSADEWVARSDRQIWDMIPPPDIPRAFNSSLDGCPVHGMELFKTGNYSWKMDPFGKPWKLVCPVGGEEYPSNDFMAYVKTKDRSLLTGDYPDDGWGWGKPGDRHKHWFIGYYCEWLWHNYLLPGVDNLAKAYQITGDPRYARKAIVMLDRIADFYPAMDYNKQSMYAKEYSSGYTGKIVNMIWETGNISSFAQTYDNVFDAIPSDESFSSPEKDSPLLGKANADIRRNIETNLLRNGFDAVFSGQIHGNYGTHQRSLLLLAIVLQDPKLTKKALDYVLENPQGNLGDVGFNYALDNLVQREGVAFESAPGYCLGWSSALSDVGGLLDKLGVDIFTNPKFKRMYTAYMQLKVLGRFTPSIGDSGGIAPSGIDLPTDMARLALREFKDPVFAKYLLDRGAYGEGTLRGYGDLKYPVIEKSALTKQSLGAVDLSTGCRDLGGYGLGILEAGARDRKVGIACYHGPTEGGHAHADKLFFELYAFDKKLIPDMGYPQFASDHRDRRAWESNTISHCTVTVDAKQQNSYCNGKLNQIAVSPDVKLLDVSAPDAYPGGDEFPKVDEYRRVMLLIGGDSEAPYMVDFFRVRGGKSHDYSLHGFEGEFRTEGIDLTAQEKGTLAGEDVPYGYLYDDLDLESPARSRNFGSYSGSGYSYLYNVNRGIPDQTWTASWSAKDCGIRAIFPEQGIREAVIADGNPPKRGGNPDKLKFVLLRNSADTGLASRFACVLQPFKSGDASLKVMRLPASSGDLLKITGAQGTDYVYLAEDPLKTVKVGELSLTGGCAVLRMGEKGEFKSAFIAGGGRIDQGSLTFKADGPQSGTVTAVDFRKGEVTLDCAAASNVAGQTIHFGDASYPIESTRIEGDKMVVTLGDSPRVGRVLVNELDPKGSYVETLNALAFASSGAYDDRWIVNEDYSKWFRVTEFSRRAFRLKEPTDLKSAFKPGADGRTIAYLFDVAPGQAYVIPAASWEGK